VLASVCPGHPDNPRDPAHGVHRTRVAPSPTGALHLGNARTFLVNWAMARQRGWRIVLRIEDLDTPRVKPGTIEQTIDLLAWLGMDWDEGPVVQSADLAPYADAMHRLAHAGRVYPAPQSRREIDRAASAPQEGAREARFPPELRPDERPRRFEPAGDPWRFAVEPGPVSFEDGFAGRCDPDPASEVGDFIVWTRSDLPAYQLAVVVDDARQGIDRIVRGDDLIGSAGRQLLLHRALGLGPEPAYWHLPLVRGEDGRRLAKRHGDTRLDTYRSRGVPPERVIGLCGFWCGIAPARRAMDLMEFREAFDLTIMDRRDVIFSAEDDAWLIDGQAGSAR